MRDLTQRFVYKALPDAIGLRIEGREHMYAFSHMVWATMGPENELFREAMVESEPVLAWLERCCDRDNLAPGGIGLALYALADEGVITQAEAKLLLQTVLAAGADTTILTMANAIQAFALFPTSTASSAPTSRWCAPPSTRACAGIRRRGWPDASRRAKSRSAATPCPPGSASG